MRFQVLLLKQDDPKKCTAAKLVKFNLVREVKKISKNSLVLDPFSDRWLLPKDEKIISSITAIDCSWNLAEKTFVNKFSSVRRKLPPLLAGNPVNYSKLGKLTSVEAISGAAFILGFKKEALDFLDKFKWGHTFYQLNKELLEDYSKLETEDQLQPTLQKYSINFN